MRVFHGFLCFSYLLLVREIHRFIYLQIPSGTLSLPYLHLFEIFSDNVLKEEFTCEEDRCDDSGVSL